jgi:hypothetical protein
VSDVTKVGPPEPDDLPRKPSGFFERIWRASWYVGLFNGIMTPLTVFRGADFFKKNAPPEVEDPWHGLPEAELTDEQRREAMERLSRE